MARALFAIGLGLSVEAIRSSLGTSLVLAAVKLVIMPSIVYGLCVASGLNPLYTIAAVGYYGNALFADALLTDVAEPRHYDRVSAFGYALGYLGGGAMFAFCVWVLASPATFGLADNVAAAKLCFLLTAGWWLLFTLPCLLWVRETPARAGPPAWARAPRGRDGCAAPDRGRP